MDISEEVRFSSPPALVREAVLAYLEKHFPQALPFVKWDSTKSRASASRLGASGTLDLGGTGPTILILKAHVGFPASLSISEEQVRAHLSQAIGELQKKAP